MTNNTDLSSDIRAAPLTVTVVRAREISGFGPTTIWALLKEGRLEAVRVPGVRRTLISYQSLLKLLASPADNPPARRRGRPRKLPLSPEAMP
jgi:hypothetical protein